MADKIIKTTIKVFDGKVAYAHRAQNLLVNGVPDRCWHLHGHNLGYRIEVECPILNEATGMGLTFGEIKDIVEEEITNKWDHSLFVDASDSLVMAYVNAAKAEWEQYTFEAAEKKKLESCACARCECNLDSALEQIRKDNPLRINVFPHTTSIENLTQAMWTALEPRFAAKGCTLRVIETMETGSSGYRITNAQ